MINANELRIGNWVYFHKSQVVQIEEINSATIGLLDRSRIFPHEVFNGIPLTPEILESCGFEFIDHSNLYHILGMDIKIENHGIYFEYGSVMATKLKHLHQLQNLYFALTGQELNVNLNVAAIK